MWSSSRMVPARMASRLYNNKPTTTLLSPAAVAPRARYASSKSVQGRTAIVTGSSRGIGKGLALRLARDGYNVCIHDIEANKAGCEEVVKEIQSMSGGSKACVALGDVSNLRDVNEVVQTCVNKLGPLDTMVANAGITQVKPILDLTEEDFDRMFRVNVFGVQNCYSSAAKQMISQGTCKADRPGKLIGAASIVAFKPFPALAHYSASKWAVRGLNQAYAVELAEHHITANLFAPGIVGTAMWEIIGGALGQKEGRDHLVQTEQSAKAATALGRAGRPEDIANLVSFLSGPDSDFITGQTQLIDGGIVFT